MSRNANRESLRGSRERQRVQFEFSPQLINAIDVLAEQLGAASRAEVIRLAVSVLKVAADNQKLGRVTIGEESLVLPMTSMLTPHDRPAAEPSPPPPPKRRSTSSRSGD